MRLMNYKYTLKSIYEPQIHFHNKEKKAKTFFISSVTILKTKPRNLVVLLTTNNYLS